MHQYFGIHCKLPLKSLILSVLWINAYGWSWFEAKDLCRSNGTIIATRSKSDNHFWTKYYRRRSHWMATLGCFFNDSLNNYKTYDVPHSLTAGLCQELCMEHFGSNRIFLFAFGKQKCVCLKDNFIDLHLHFDICKSDCIGDFGPTKDCDDKVLVLLSKPITEGHWVDALSNSTCVAMSCDTVLTRGDLIEPKDCKKTCSESENFLQNNQNPKHCTETMKAYLESVLNKGCDAANFGSSGKTLFILKRRVYLSYDRENVNLTNFEKKNLVIDCQRCLNSCSYTDCNNNIGDIVCKNGLIKTDSPSMSTPFLQTTVLSPQTPKERIDVNHTWVTDDVSTTLIKKQTFSLTPNRIDSGENINTLKTTSINQINRQRNEDDTMKHVGIVAVSIPVCALIIAGAFYFIRRKKFQIKRECPNISLLTECSSVGTQRTSHNNENNQRIDKISLGNSPTECLYDLADNSKLEEQTQYNQENEALYYYLRENVPTNNVNNDTYMLAGYKTSDEDTVYFGGMEDPYDHLRGTRGRYLRPCTECRRA